MVLKKSGIRIMPVVQHLEYYDDWKNAYKSFRKTGRIGSGHKNINCRRTFSG